MAKLKNVTLAEFKDAEEKMFDVSQIVGDLHNRASQGYAESVPEPLAMATSFASASRTLAEMASYFMMKAALDEQRRTIAENLKKS